MQDLVAVAEHQRAKAVPLRLEDPARRPSGSSPTRLASIGRTGGLTGVTRRTLRESRAVAAARVQVASAVASSCSRRRAARASAASCSCARGATFELARRMQRRRRAARRGLQLPLVALLPRQAHLRAALRGAARRLPGRARDHARTAGSCAPETRDHARATCARSRACRSTPPSARYARAAARDAAALRARLPRGRARSCCSAASRRRSTSTCCSRCSAARCCFPGDFVGRGDMSRGGLLLRAAHAGVELDYAPVDGADATRRAAGAPAEGRSGPARSGDRGPPRRSRGHPRGPSGRFRAGEPLTQPPPAPEGRRRRGRAPCRSARSACGEREGRGAARRGRPAGHLQPDAAGRVRRARARARSAPALAALASRTASTAAGPRSRSR